MEDKDFLFRQEVTENRLNRNFGTIRINVPFHYRIAGMCSIALIILMSLFFCFAQISERTYIRGYLDSEYGIVSVHSQEAGIIHHVAIEEGAAVHKGDVLFRFSSPNRENTQALIDNVTHRLRNLKREFQLKKEHYHALEHLMQKNFISKTQLKDAELELLELTNKIQFEKSELIKYKQHQRYWVRSPIDGVITNILYKQGQMVDASKTLVQIIPDDAALVARLYIPSKAMGFLKKGDVITLKYDAYPSERFGFYKACIKEINLTVLTDEKEDKPIRVGEPYYKIKAELETPYVSVYGQKEALSHGMTLTAVITGKKKKIWEWVLDPLYSYYGDVFS